MTCPLCDAPLAYEGPREILHCPNGCRQDRPDEFHEAIAARLEARLTTPEHSRAVLTAANSIGYALELQGIVLNRDQSIAVATRLEDQGLLA